MKNKILKLSEETFKLAGQAIRDGEVIVVPTDAVYAVVCDANNEKAVEKLRRIRKSNETKPLSIIMDKKEIKNYCIIQNETYEKLMEELLPGKISFLLNKNGNIFEYAVPNNDSLCVFWQDNETKKVYEESGRILAISSANTATNPEATTIEKAIEYFGDEIAMYIDCEEERGKSGTTQLDLRESTIKVMRESDTLPLSLIKDFLKEKGITI